MKAAFLSILIKAISGFVNFGKGDPGFDRRFQMKAAFLSILVKVFRSYL